jgi:hypothetical protein
MTRHKCFKISLGVTAATIVVWMATCILYSCYVRCEAERCFRIFSRFRTGSSTIEEATKALRPFRCFEVDGTARLYGSDYPLHTYLFKNEGTHLLGIFHPTYFQVGLTSRPDGVVIEMSASLFQMPFHSVTTRESIVESQHIQALHDSSSGMIVSVFDPPMKMNVSLNPLASDVVRKSAYGYDLACFTALHGCQTVYEILPTVKQHITK